MVLLSTKALLSYTAVAMLTLSTLAVDPAHARGGGRGSTPTMKMIQKQGGRFADNTLQEARTKTQFAENPETSTDTGEPGWVIELISICDHLEGTDIKCE